MSIQNDGKFHASIEAMLSGISFSISLEKRAPAFISALLIVLWLFVPSFPARSAALRQMSIEEMTAVATGIIRGAVSESHTTQNGRTIFTHYTLGVSERWKGAANATEDVAFPGGALNGVQQTFAGVPTLRIGQAYVLFLWKGATGPVQTVGLTQGVFEVSPGENGPLMASRASAGEIMMDAKGKPVVDHAFSLRVSALRTRVEAARGAASSR